MAKKREIIEVDEKYFATVTRKELEQYGWTVEDDALVGKFTQFFVLAITNRQSKQLEARVQGSLEFGRDLWAGHQMDENDPETGEPYRHVDELHFDSSTVGMGVQILCTPEPLLGVNLRGGHSHIAIPALRRNTGKLL